MLSRHAHSAFKNSHALAESFQDFRPADLYVVAATAYAVDFAGILRAAPPRDDPLAVVGE